MPLIVLEGCDFSGKTTTAKELQKRLTNAVFLREPGSTPLSEAVREAMKTHRMSVSARQLLMHGSRLEMVQHFNFFRDTDTLYVLDRYVPSTLVYGSVDGVKLSTLFDLTYSLFPVPRPDMIFIVDPGFEVIRQRSTARNLDFLEGHEDRLKLIHYTYRRFYEQGIIFPSVRLEGKEPWKEILYHLVVDMGLTKFVK